MEILTSNHKPQISWPDTANVTGVDGVPEIEILEFVATKFGNKLHNYFSWHVDYLFVPEINSEIASVALHKD